MDLTDTEVRVASAMSHLDAIEWSAECWQVTFCVFLHVRMAVATYIQHTVEWGAQHRCL